MLHNRSKDANFARKSREPHAIKFVCGSFFINSRLYKLNRMIKQVIIDILDYLKWEVANDRCTPDQLQSIHDALSGKLSVEATADDLAEYFGKRKENVRNVLSRSPMPRPKRRVYYSFTSFLKHMPKSWRNT